MIERLMLRLQQPISVLDVAKIVVPFARPGGLAAQEPANRTHGATGLYYNHRLYRAPGIVHGHRTDAETLFGGLLQSTIRCIIEVCILVLRGADCKSNGSCGGDLCQCSVGAVSLGRAE